MVRVVHMVKVVNLHMVPEGNQFKTIRDGVALPYLLLTLLTHLLLMGTLYNNADAAKWQICLYGLL